MANGISTPEAVENALRATMREYMAAVPGLWIRTSRNQTKELPANGDGGGVAFPQIFISASPKYYENVAATWDIDISVAIFTHIDDDPDGRQSAAIEAALEEFLDRVFQFNGGTEEQSRFVALVREAVPGFNYGECFNASAASAPAVQDMARALTQTFTLHFSL